MKIRNNQEGIAPLIIIIAITFLAIGGITYWRISQNGNTKKATVLTSSKSDLPTDLSGLLTVDKIKDLALAEKSGATIKQVELEMINNTLVYRVQLLDGTLLAFNAKDGTKVTLSGDETSEKEEDDIPANAVISITFQKAVEIAQAKYPTKTIRKVEFEFEEGKVVYSVRFSDGSRVDVDATSGVINKAKDSLIEDKDKDDDGVEDDKEKSESSNSNNVNNQSRTESKNESTEKQESEEDSDDDDKEEDKIEYKKPESEKDND